MLLIIDPHNWGHHPSVTNLIASYLIEQGQEVTCACAFTITHPAVVHIPIEPIKSVTTNKHYLHAWHSHRLWDTYRNAYQAARKRVTPTKIFIPMVDSLNYYNTVISESYYIPLPWVGLFVHPTREIRLRLKTGTHYTYNELLPQIGAPFPDITNTQLCAISPLADYIKQLAGGRKIVLSIGEISERKCDQEMLSSAEKLTDHFFITVGKHKRLLQNAPKNFVQLDVIVPEEEFNNVLNLADIVWIIYKDFPHSSNILTKAAYLDKYVVVNNEAPLSLRVKTFNLGTVCDYTDINSIIAGITNCYEVSGKEYMSKNDISLLRSILC